MNNQVWDTDFTYNGPTAVKVSCHAGDYGTRAMCNMIGDQPLFYIDDSVEEDFTLEELLIVDGLSARDEKIIDEMRAKIKAYDKSAKLLSEMNLTDLDTQFNAFLNTKAEKITIETILEFANQSGTFKSYYDFTIKSGITLSINDSVETSFYDAKAKIIFVNSNIDVQSASLSILKSMRLVWLQKQGALINPLAFQPEQAILINRMLAADSDITSIAMMWDMKLAGVEDMWMNAMAGSNYDLCSAYAMEAMTDFRAIKSGLALRATFEKWFISGRCKSFDRDIIQIMMSKHTDIQINHEDASRVVALDVIAAMGRRPTGNNYLSSIAVQIINDGLFNDVRDRSNANFLWFITFERRMSEMEQELQEGSMTNNKQDKQNVVSLPNLAVDHTEIGGDHKASVFFLDHFRAI